MMEDRYLFRGKDVKSNLFVIDFYSACPEGIPEDGITLLHYITDINNNVFVVYLETVGQCTGLKDKNSILVFDGDIVKHDVFGIKEVVWGNKYEKALSYSCGFMYDRTIAFVSTNDENECW